MKCTEMFLPSKYMSIKWRWSCFVCNHIYK